MFPGLLATVVLAPAQPPAAPAPPTQPTAPAQTAPAQQSPTVGAPPSIDPCPGSDQQQQSRFSFNTTHSGPPWTFWGGVDYRMMWLRPAPAAGVLATRDGVPFGDTQTEFGRANGIGLDLGGWLNDRHTWGVTAGGLLLEQKSVAAAVAGPGLIVRPFNDALTAQPNTFLVNDPASGVTGGGLATAQGIRLSGFDVGLVNNLTNDCNWSADFLAGFRYLDLDEYLAVTQTSTVNVAGGLPFPGGNVGGPAALTISDRFRTRNQFYGPQVGLRGEYRPGMFFANATGKLGLGNNHERVDIDGRTDVAGRAGVPGGFLATDANIGQFTTNRFAVLVDLSLSAGVQFAAWGRAKVGYDFLYLNDVARPGQQVDATINSRFVPTSRNFTGAAGLRSPLPTGRTDDFYAHGFRVGLELLY